MNIFIFIIKIYIFILFNIHKFYMKIILENESLNQIIQAAKNPFPPKIFGQTRCSIVIL